MYEQHMPTIVALDLDNTVWYGNYQRHGYLFSELLFRVKNKIALDISIQFPFEQFLWGWNIYSANLHLTAPQQLDLFFELLIQGGFLDFQHEMQRKHFRQECVEWLENKYWEVVSHPERLYIADQSYEYGRKISLVPGIHASLSFLKQQKASRGLKIYAVSLNLSHISTAILNTLGIANIFDAVFGVTWDEIALTKEEIFQKILQENHVRGKQVIVIGDAIADVGAGQKVGAKTVAIATGPTPYHQLLACQPDTIIQQWPETAEEIEQLFSL